MTQIKNGDISLKRVNDFSDNKHPSLTLRNEEIDLDKAIELTGFGWYHAGLVMVCGFGLTLMCFEVLGISFILPAAQCDLALTTTDKSYLSGVTFLGMVLSAHAWGFCADTYGRRKILLISGIGTWMFSFSSSFAPNPGIFTAFRFLTGLFLCGNTSTVYAYLSEFLASSNRSKIMTWTCGFVAAAYLIIPGLAWVLLPVEMNLNLGFIIFTSWRMYIVALGSLSFILTVVFFFFPESPKFLMMVGKKEEALQVLRNIYAINTGNDVKNYPVKNLKFEKIGLDEESDQSHHVYSSVSLTPRSLVKIMWRQTAPLFCRPYGWTTLLFCTLQFNIYVSCNGIYLWMPNLLNMMRSSDNSSASTSPETICEFVAYHKENFTPYSSTELTECSNAIRSEVYVSTLIVGVSYLITYSTYGGLVSMFGKQNVLVSSLFLSGIAGVGSYFTRNEILLSILLSGFVAASGTCISVLSAAIVDSYPTHLRAMAVSLALTCGRLGSGVAGNVIGLLIESYCDFTIIGLGCVALGSALLCLLLPK